jgi:PhzF family phenazine biosynthesis protein
MRLAFRLLNVFALPGQPLSGNPLCVFEDASGLADATMQALARQFNLSETTFLFSPTVPEATARVRIFTPSFEMPFAGHPTLGSAHVVRSLFGGVDRVSLEMKVGVVEVNARGDEWTLRTARSPAIRTPEASRAELASMLRLPHDAIAEAPLWVDTGAEQLVVPLTSPEHVRAARPDAELLARLAYSPSRKASMAHVWARLSREEVLARFFFLSGGAVVEDPATGSACANLGGWMIARGAELPLRLQVHQGEQASRPSSLGLHVDAEKSVFVSGLVVALGRGEVSL